MAGLRRFAVVGRGEVCVAPTSSSAKGAKGSGRIQPRARANSGSETADNCENSAVRSSEPEDYVPERYGQPSTGKTATRSATRATKREMRRTKSQYAVGQL